MGQKLQNENELSNEFHVCEWGATAHSLISLSASLGLSKWSFHCVIMMIYSGELNTWNAAHALNRIHDFTSFGSSPSSLTPPRQYPAGQQGIRRSHSSRRKRKSPSMFSPEIWRDDTCEGLPESDRERFESDFLSQSVGLINIQRICNICRSQKQRILGNRGWVTDYRDSIETTYW